MKIYKELFVFLFLSNFKRNENPKPFGYLSKIYLRSKNGFEFDRIKQCYFDSFKINRDTKYKTTTTNKWL